MKNFFKNLLTIIFTGMFFITMILLIVILNVSYFFKTDNVTKGVMQMDVAKALEEMENSNTGGSTITEVLDNAYIVAEYYGVSSDVIDEMVNDNAIKEFFGMIAGNMTDYIINGTENTVLTSKDFDQILDDNIDEWIAKSKVEVTKEQKEQFLDTVKSQSGQIIDNLPTTSVIANELEINNLDEIQELFSEQSKIIMGILFGISLIMIIILKWKNHRNIIYIGYTALIAGILTIGIGLFSNDLITMVLAKSEIFLDVSLFGNMLMRQFLITGAILLILALILYVTHLILKVKAH